MQILKCVPATKIPLPGDQQLSYYSSEDIPVGCLVRVPLRGRDTTGLVTESDSIKDKKLKIKQEEFELKKISSPLSSTPIFSSEYIQLIKWASKYWWEPMGLFLKNALVERGKTDFYKSLPKPDFPLEKGEKLKEDFWFQSELQEELRDNLKKAAKKNETTLLLVPELQQLEGFEKKLSKWKIPFQVYSGETTKKEKKEVWNKILDGSLNLLLGTKKALFLPWPNLDQLIVTDEVNSHYKAWGRHPKYHGKHLAFKLAKLQKAKVILTANTPSLQSYRKFYQTEKFDRNPENLNNKLKRTETNFELINRSKEDDWEDPEQEFAYFSKRVQEMIEKSFSSSERSQILFLHPRRGTSTAILCKDCGHIFSCSNCSVSFTFHRDKGEMLCHYCGKTKTPPEKCSECGSHRLKYGGVGTQKLEEILKDLFSKKEGLRLDSDVVSKDKEKEEIIKQFQKQCADYLIATQMVLASALDSFDLVVLPNLDLFVDRPDFRAFERTLYLLKKLETYTGSIVGQSFFGEASLLEDYNEEKYDRFYKKELKKRKSFFYPPYSQITKLETEAKREKDSLKQAKILKKKIENYLEKEECENIKVLGPSPDFPLRVGGKFRHKLILKVARDKLGLRNRLLAFSGPQWEVNVEPEEL